MVCVKECPAGAISRNETVVINIGGKKCEWGKLDTGKCKLTQFGFNRLNSPFVAKDMPGFHLDVAKQEMTWFKAAYLWRQRLRSGLLRASGGDGEASEQVS